MRGLTGRLVLVVLVALVIGACGPSASERSAASPSRPGAATATEVASSEATSPEPDATEDPTPAETADATAESSAATDDPFLGRAVMTIVDRIRVRSQPRVSNDSVRQGALLPVGTSLFVVGGPVSASGYTWYGVAPLLPSTADLRSGWIASASLQGAPWIEVTALECPPEPTDVQGLLDLPLGARVGCFAGQPITIQARLVECNCDVNGGSYDPAWFGWGGRTGLLVDPSKTEAPASTADWLAVLLDPAGEHPDELPLGEVVEVTGMFDHPAARACLYQGPENAPPAPTDDCRYRFATTSLVAQGP